MLTSELELPVDKTRGIIREIVEIIASGYSSKPSKEAIIKKARRFINQFYEYIVSRVLDELNDLSEKQLEYVITRGGRALLSEASRLYSQARKYNREDLIDILRDVWNTSGHRELIECPRCGFKSVLPDRNCLICGYSVPEDYVRRSLNFEEKFSLYVKSASIAELNDTLQHGYVLVGNRGVYCPRSMRARKENTILYPVYLRRNEISIILEEMHSRELPV